MSLETDLLLDRRHLKRRLLLWRGLAVLAIVAAVLGTIHASRDGEIVGRDYVARLTVSGVILDNRKLTERLAALAKNDQAKALLVMIDSPGGSMGGGETLYRVLLAVAEKKPVIAVMRGTAASAGYMIAMPAARIFARESTITGSIGVRMDTTEFSGLMRTLGIRAESFVSGPLKDQPSMTHPVSPEGRLVLQGLIDDLYDQFVEIVARGRKMDQAAVRRLADGRAYTGRQALVLGLIDAIGDEIDARAWLVAHRDIPNDLPTRDLAAPGLADRFLDRGGESLFGGIWKALFSQGVMLDGAWAIWQSAKN
ncbi:MAG: signal peptide peptidase SppA [Acetobacteraceae bacterium]|nr:signal peptide peptidase SppA [Acetobacteraceae bacterium]